MNTMFIPFFLVPLLIYTYFWLNPIAFATFIEGVSKYIIEAYLGYKAWRLAWETEIAYRAYKRASKKLAQEQGYPAHVVKLYFDTYGSQDWRHLWQQQKAAYEEKYKNLEDDLRDSLLF